MAVPAIPTNFAVQQANGQVLASWGIVSGATAYVISRSTDGITYTTLSSSTTTPFYLDTTALVGTLYYYQVASKNTSGTSSPTSALQVIPTLSGQMSLQGIRTLAQQRADRVNSNFVTLSEWNTFINQSCFELYDVLVTLYEDMYVAPALTFQTDGIKQLYPLPDGVLYNAAPAFYKLLGVDCGVSNTPNSFVTLKKFTFEARNRYVLPNNSASAMGVFNLKYRLLGSNIEFIPLPSAGQTIQLWYIPRLKPLLQETDIIDGVSGWTEYIVVDAAIKALMKEESDVSGLMAQKQALLERIQSSAVNRDAGMPDTISDTRNAVDQISGYNSPLGWF
jgi:hypothetical protein